MQMLSDNIGLVVLTGEPKLGDQIKAVTEGLDAKQLCHVILDFSHVDILTSASISNLIVLRDSLRRLGQRLVLCNAAPATKCIFKVVGLEGLFAFCLDCTAAVQVLPGRTEAIIDDSEPGNI